MPNLADKILAIPERQLLRQLVEMFQAEDRRGLIEIQKEIGIQDCGCKTFIIPCQKHKTDCDCPVQIRPCRHTGNPMGNLRPDIPFSVQILLLFLLWPEKYQDPPLDSKPCLALIKAGKIPVMRWRHEQNPPLQIFHPEDLMQRGIFVEGIDRTIYRGPSGAAIPGQVVSHE